MNAEDFPWLKCNNTENCRPFAFTESEYPTTPIPTTPDPSDYVYGENYDYKVDPAREFFDSTESLNVTTIGALFLSWLAITAPLVLGLKSLLPSFYLAFPLTHFFNLLLFFRALTLSGLGVGLTYMFMPDFDDYGRASTWMKVLQSSLGFWFCANYGVLFVIGKHVKETTFAFPSVLIAGVAVFILNLLNLFKIAGFMGFFGELAEVEYSNFFYSSTPFVSIVVVLSVQPVATFWLVVHFAYTLCSLLPPAALILEVLVSSVTELLPASMATRNRFPHSLALPGVFGLLGFVGSIIAIYVRSTAGYVPYFQSYYFMNFVYAVAVIFFVQAIAFLSLSKVATAGHEDLLAFVQRQSTRRTATVFKILVGVSLVAAGFLAYILVPVIPGTWGSDSSFSIPDVDYAHPTGLTIYVLVLLVLFLLVVFGTALVQSILSCTNGKKHPCCLPLGKRLVDVEENADKVEMQ